MSFRRGGSARQERAGREHHRAAAISRPSFQLHAADHGRPSRQQIPASPSTTVETGWSSIARLHRCAIELAVGLRPRSAHAGPLRRLSIRNWIPAHPPHGPSGRRAHRSRGPDGPCQGRRSRGCRTSRRWSRSGASRASYGTESCGRRRGFRARMPPPTTMTSDFMATCFTWNILNGFRPRDVNERFHVKPISRCRTL